MHISHSPMDAGAFSVYISMHQFFYDTVVNTRFASASRCHVIEMRVVVNFYAITLFKGDLTHFLFSLLAHLLYFLYKTNDIGTFQHRLVDVFRSF